MKKYITLSNAALFLFARSETYQEDRNKQRKTAHWVQQKRFPVRKKQNPYGRGFLYNVADLTLVKEYLHDRKHI